MSDIASHTKVSSEAIMLCLNFLHTRSILEKHHTHALQLLHCTPLKKLRICVGRREKALPSSLPERQEMLF